VIRGGAYDVPRERATTTYRGVVPPDKGFDKTGFRCVRDVMQ
jgi:formylglycine-generating enzyme required for sulfatase activity